jgi:hypothetical protein
MISREVSTMQIFGDHGLTQLFGIKGKTARPDVAPEAATGMGSEILDVNSGDEVL